MAVFLTGLAAFAGGGLVSWGNYLLLRRLMKSRGESGVAFAAPIRTLTGAAWLLILYFVGKRTALNSGALLVGGALGLTALLAFFTIRLTRGSKPQGKE